MLCLPIICDTIHSVSVHVHVDIVQLECMRVTPTLEDIEMSTSDRSHER